MKKLLKIIGLILLAGASGGSIWIIVKFIIKIVKAAFFNV